MNKRFLAYYTLLIVAVLTFSYLQNLYYPAVPRDNEQVSAQESDETATDLEQETDEDLISNSNDAINETSENQVDADENADGFSSADSDATPEPRELYTLGSIAPDSQDRYLITFDSVGGTVRRVELNFRKPSNPSRFKYRDLEYEGGYLGELDCVDTAEGCAVRVVGNGTPADVAGLLKGDVIKSVEGESILDAEDLGQVLSDLKPRQQIELKYSREGSDQTATIELTDKPTELIRPQPDILEKAWPAEPSFKSTLRKPSRTEVWSELDPTMMSANWKLESKDEQSITFSYLLDQATLDANNSELKGPIKFVKKYSLVRAPEEATEVKDFHFLLEIEIENLSDAQQELCYQLDGPLGTPSETWWYQNKIHGRNWAIGYVAGARDVVGSSAQEDFTFFGGPEIVDNLTSSAPKYFWLLKPPAQTGDAQQVNYMSVDTQYFNVALLPEGEQPFSAYSVLADAATTDVPDNVKEQKLVDCTFRMFKVIDLEPQGVYKQAFEIFAGPKEANVLAKYALDDVRSFGWFAMFSKPLCWLLEFFHTITFQMGYGIPIILLTVLVRCIMIPVSRKAALNAQMMQYLQPQMKELADKYKDDMEKRGQAQRDLFRKYNYNPFSGCLMGLIQIPIFIGLYRGLSVDIALRDQPLFPGLNWCSNLSAPDQFWYWKDSLPGFMDFLTSETGWLGPFLNILPIITCVLFIVQQKLFMPPATDENQAMMQKAMQYAMIFMGVLFFKVPAGLCLYFITSSLWGIIERKMLPKPELDKSKLDDIGNGSKASAKALQKRAKSDEAEEQKRRDNVELKKRRDKERKKKLKRRDHGAEGDNAA